MRGTKGQVQGVRGTKCKGPSARHKGPSAESAQHKGQSARWPRLLSAFSCFRIQMLTALKSAAARKARTMAIAAHRAKNRAFSDPCRDCPNRIAGETVKGVWDVTEEQETDERWQGAECAFYQDVSGETSEKPLLASYYLQFRDTSVENAQFEKNVQNTCGDSRFKGRYTRLCWFELHDTHVQLGCGFRPIMAKQMLDHMLRLSRLRGAPYIEGPVLSEHEPAFAECGFQPHHARDGWMCRTA